MTIHKFPNRQPAPSPRAGATCPGVSPPSPGQGLADSATMAALREISARPTHDDWAAMCRETITQGGTGASMAETFAPDEPATMMRPDMQGTPRFLNIRDGMGDDDRSPALTILYLAAAGAAGLLIAMIVMEAIT